VPTHRSSIVIAAVMAALTLVGCSTTRVSSPRDWTDTAVTAAGNTVTVNVHDTSGRIDNVEFDQTDVRQVKGVANPAGQPRVLVVPWVGGACDKTTAIDIAAAGSGLSITIRTTVAPGDCDAIGVGHALRLTGLEDLPASLVTVTTPTPTSS
jgi:outer membrane murein-binding lipoprotein Lpp